MVIQDEMFSTMKEQVLMKTRLKSLFPLVILLLSVLLSIPPAAAERPDAPPYGKRGPFAVGTRDLTITDGDYPLDVTIWYPALKEPGVVEEVTYRWLTLEGTGRAILNGEPDRSQAPYPLIVFSHGLSGLRYQLVAYTEHLASWGFVVMAADHPGSTFRDMLLSGPEGIVNSFANRPFEIVRQIDFAQYLNQDLLKGMIDTDTTGVTGHSFGGYTTLAVGGARLDLGTLAKTCEQTQNDRACLFANAAGDIAAKRGIDLPYDGIFPPTTDPRIKAIAPLAPLSQEIFGEPAGADIRLPMMLMVGSQDQSTPPEQNAYPIYESVSSTPKAMVVFENAGHYIFVDKCPPLLIQMGRFELCSDRVWDMDRAHDLINHFATAFFMYTIKGDQTALAALDPAEVKFTGLAYQASLKP